MTDSKLPLGGVDSTDRRALGVALLGMLGGAAFLQGCSSAEGGPEVTNAQAAATTIFTATGDAGATSPVTTVSTVAELQAIAMTATDQGNIAVLEGYWSAGDGGGGVFFWAGGDATPTNGGTVFRATAGTGCWKRIYSGALNIQWFGALGGTGDPALAFAAALAALPSVAGTGTKGTIYVPPGVYALRSPINLTNLNGVRIVGEAAGGSYLTANFTTYQNAIINLTTCSRCRIQGLTLRTSPGTTTPGSAIYITVNAAGTSGNEVVDVTIGDPSDGGGSIAYEFGVGIGIESNFDGNNEQHLIQNCNIWGCSQQGIYFLYCSTSNFNTIIGGQIGDCPTAIRCAGGNFRLYGTVFGPRADLGPVTVLQLAYVDDPPSGPPSNLAQRYPILMVGARFEAAGSASNQLVQSTGTGSCHVHMVDFSWNGGASPLITFNSSALYPNSARLVLDSCNIVAGGPVDEINTAVINVSGAGTQLVVTNSMLIVAGVNLTSGAGAFFSGNVWTSAPSTMTTRVTPSTGSIVTVLNDSGSIPPVLPTSAPPGSGQFYNGSGFLRIA